MKKFILISALLLCYIVQAVAQPLDMSQKVENDPAVRVGVLDNGIRYYLRANAKDPKRANFHIVYDVGAIQEEDRQDGLAHFLEHMAFNGSKNFPGNGLIDYCTSIGVAFGENLNAGTGQELTTYMITNVPITREGIIDSMLLVLHDWAGFITLAEKDIDEERGVIQEEWRLYEGMASQRVSRKETAALFGADNIYSQRDIIGSMDNLKTFKYEDIRDFYYKWYRPDMQAFIIVGDFDVDVMEQKLKATMADIKEHDVKTPKAKVKVEPNAEPRFMVATDPELTETKVELLIRLNPIPKKYNNTIMAQKQSMLNSMATDMLNERLTNIAKEAGAPFVESSVNVFSHYAPFDLLTLSVSARDGEAAKSFSAAYTELLRAARGGFAEPEMERVKANMLSHAESQYNNRNDRRNGQYVNFLLSNFIKNSPYPAAQVEYDLDKALVESTTLEELNAHIASIVTDLNNVVTLTAQVKEGVVIPTEADLAATMAAVKASTIEPYTEQVITRPLLDAAKLKGSAVAKTEKGKFESTVWTLKNGVKIVVKPTQYKADEILLQGVKKGGQSTIADLADLYSIGLWTDFESVAGVSDFSNKELTRLVSGKTVSLSPYVSDINAGFNGRSSIKDIETMLQLTYLYATAPRFEAADWQVMMDQLITKAKGQVKNPMYIFQDSMAMLLSGGNPRAQLSNEKTLAMTSLERLKTTYNKLFSSATDMTFFITGSVDLEALKPLVEKYIGSIPAPKTKIAAAVGPYVADLPKGVTVNRFVTPQEQARVIAVETHSGSVDYSLAERINLDCAGDVLQTIYTRTIREEKGGVYVVQNQMQVRKNPAPRFMNLTLFLTDTSKLDGILPLVGQGIDSLVANGPSVENLTKAKENFTKNFADNNNSNGTWSGYLVSWYMWGIDAYTDYLSTLEAVNVNSVQQAAKRAFEQGNCATLVQLP